VPEVKAPRPGKAPRAPRLSETIAELDALEVTEAIRQIVHAGEMAAEPLFEAAVEPEPEPESAPAVAPTPAAAPPPQEAKRKKSSGGKPKKKSKPRLKKEQAGE
jgi:hypothetical protein